MKRGISKGNKKLLGIKNKGGKLLTNRKSIITKIIDFYRKLYSKKNKREHVSDDAAQKARTANNNHTSNRPQIMKREVQAAIKLQAHIK